MSGRRRRDDGWGDGRQDAQNTQHDRRDPWADSDAGEWADTDRDHGDNAGWPGAPSGASALPPAPQWGNGGADAPLRGEPTVSTKGYAAPPPPSFPSFPLGGGKHGAPGGQPGYDQAGPGDDGHGAGSGYGGQRGPANGHAPGGYGEDQQRDAGYGRGADGRSYPGSGSGPPAQAAPRRDPAGYGETGLRSGGDGGYGKPGYEPASGYGNDPGYGGANGYGVNGRAGGATGVPGFTPADNDDLEDDGPAAGPRPIGRLSIYTLHDDRTREFDRIAERAAEGVRAAEPDTLVYVIHVVPKVPLQRIIYEIYRDRAAFLSHERQPHIRQFAADRASCVLATNVIDLRLKYAKVGVFGSAPDGSAPPQPGWEPPQPGWDQRPAETAAGNDRYPAAPRYQPAQYPGAQYREPQYQEPQYSGPQYASAQSQGSQYREPQYQETRQQAATAASFTPADRYPAENRQYSATGREQYPTSAQYDYSANGAYGAGNDQYGAANGYPGTTRYANGGSYPSARNSPGPNGYQDGHGYQGASVYPGGNGYQSANGYPDPNGYSNGSGYSGGAGYPNGAGYNGGSYAGEHPGHGGEAPGAQYTPRYRELTSGGQPDAPGDSQRGSAYPGEGSRRDDDGRQQSPRSPEWNPRPQDER